MLQVLCHDHSNNGVMDTAIMDADVCEVHKLETVVSLLL